MVDQRVMRVIASEPGHWFLIEDGARLLLDVNCSHGAASYDFVMELSDAEVADYLLEGRAFVGHLAEQIQYSAPGVRGSASSYRERCLAKPRQEEVNDVAATWLRAQERTR